uniref:Uncharacterized protein n=1 Tax=Rhinopithecus bieti TaxID=61621 RepID=A0A2K6JVL6_RHIBE
MGVEDRAPGTQPEGALKSGPWVRVGVKSSLEENGLWNLTSGVESSFQHSLAM